MQIEVILGIKSNPIRVTHKKGLQMQSFFMLDLLNKKFNDTY